MKNSNSLVPSPEDSRITMRLPANVKERIQQAADLVSLDIQEFVLIAALEKATDILEREKTILFSKSDAALLLNQLDNPSQPNAALSKAFKRFKSFQQEQSNEQESK
mgnify:CR=1 FL=1